MFACKLTAVNIAQHAAEYGKLIIKDMKLLTTLSFSVSNLIVHLFTEG